MGRGGEWREVGGGWGGWGCNEEGEVGGGEAGREGRGVGRRGGGKGEGWVRSAVTREVKRG